MVDKISASANPVVGEAALPDLPVAADEGTEGMRMSAFDYLDRMLRWTCSGITTKACS